MGAGRQRRSLTGLRWALVSALAGLGLACSGGSVVRVDLDALEPSFGRSQLKSLVVVVDDGVGRWVVAVDARDGAGLEALPRFERWAGERPVEYVVFAYQESLEALRIRGPGLAEPGEGADAAPIPRAGEPFRATVTSEGVGPWRALGSDDAPYAEFRSPRFKGGGDPCRSFASRAVPLDTREPVSAVVRLARGGVLVATSRTEQLDALPPEPESRLYLASADGTVERVDGAVPEFWRSIRSLRINALHESEDGRLWIFTGGLRGGDSRLWVGDLQRGFVEVEAPPDGQWQRWVIGPVGRNGPPFHVMTDYGALRRYDEGRGFTETASAAHGLQPCQSTVGNVPGTQGVVLYCGHLSWRPGGELLAVAPHGHSAWRFLPPAFDARAVAAFTDPVSITAIGETPLGLVVASSGQAFTDFYVYDDAARRFRPLELGVTTQRVYSIHPLDDGFVFSGSYGYLTQYVPGRTPRLCPSIDGFASGVRPTRFTPLDDRTWLLTGWQTADQATTLVFATVN